MVARIECLAAEEEGHRRVAVLLQDLALVVLAVLGIGTALERSRVLVLEHLHPENRGVETRSDGPRRSARIHGVHVRRLLCRVPLEQDPQHRWQMVAQDIGDHIPVDGGQAVDQQELVDSRRESLDASPTAKWRLAPEPR